MAHVGRSERCVHILCRTAPWDPLEIHGETEATVLHIPPSGTAADGALLYKKSYFHGHPASHVDIPRLLPGSSDPDLYEGNVQYPA